MRARIATALIAALLIAPMAGAQFRRQRPRYAAPQDFDGSFQFCRIVFRQNPNGDGGDWSVDWPRADENLSIRLSELTKTSVGFDESGTPKHVLIRLGSPELFRCPFIMMTEVGALYMDEVEAKSLREYLMKGGFLWADDFWGSYAWQWWSGQIAKALPPREYPIFDVPLDHPIFHTLFNIKEIPQIPNIGLWVRAQLTSERGEDSAVPHFRGINDSKGRLIVVMTHNTDFGDAYERE